MCAETDGTGQVITAMKAEVLLSKLGVLSGCRCGNDGTWATRSELALGRQNWLQIAAAMASEQFDWMRYSQHKW